MFINKWITRKNYMAIKDLHAFLNTYFTSHQCQVNNETEGIIHVQLTEEMDKILMNRPFYWHYIKQMGRTGDPMHLTLITDTTKTEEERSEEHTSELQSRFDLVCRLLLGKKKD